MDDNYQFINSYYIKEKYTDLAGNKLDKPIPDALIVAYKKNGEQILNVIKNPKFSFYITKPENKLTHYKENMPYDKLDKITILYKDLTKFLIEYNGEATHYFNIKNDYTIPAPSKIEMLRNMEKKSHGNPNVFGSDVSINDYYKMEFAKKYGVNIGNYKKGVFDIETEGASDPKIAAYPVNCLSYYDFYTDTMYVLIWDQPERWNTFTKFKQSVEDGSFIRELKADPEMNGEFERINGKKIGITNVNTTYKFEFFNDEFNLICRFYNIIHECAPDFLLAWNFSFDNLTLINRLNRYIEETGLDIRVEDIICDPNVPKEYRFWRFREDNGNTQKHPHEKWHILTIPGKTNYLCSMASYAYIRKTAGQLPSYQLNYVCMKELGKGKVDYHGIASSPVELPYKDFAMHIHYNIRDTWLLAELEIRHHDIDSLMFMSQYCDIANVNKVTTIFKNTLQMFYDRKGLAIGNNINIITNPKKGVYSGAIVAEPSLNEAILTPLFSYPSTTIRPYIIDNDLTSMYPMIDVSHNIYMTTLISHMYKIGTTTGHINLSEDNGVFDIFEVMDNYQCNQPTRWCHDYLQLPDFMQLYNDIKNELKELNKC